ncbi:protein of unknown function (DU1801) [Ekhidna lutea]|uniref:YdhG-like domain-containing protein n=1 Tax=Ekhidna lutea TaxID=447679 RepID=A0A239K3D6_EKHLU|nr:DUF1801 domain-containing protein [Ekhidna lutea]SNT12876.1 protein of unknown function (DU1801) [Ekhidna lutea]
MSDVKTQPTDQSVDAFIDSIEPESKRDDAREVLKLMKKVSGEDPIMWGDSIVGFGKYHYVYESGREGDWMLTGFSPRKQSLTLYLMSGYEKMAELLQKLGKYKHSVSCLYIKRLSDIDMDVLEEMIRTSIEIIKKRYAEHN